MPTTHQVSDVVDKVKAKLTEAKREGVHLEVTSEKLEDDWLYIVLAPTKAGERASDHARLMSRIEKELRKDGDDKVLLVPALDE
jgi:adenylosuccinate lyase